MKRQVLTGSFTYRMRVSFRILYKNITSYPIISKKNCDVTTLGLYKTSEGKVKIILEYYNVTLKPKILGEQRLARGKERKKVNACLHTIVQHVPNGFSKTLHDCILTVWSQTVLCKYCVSSKWSISVLYTSIILAL